MAKLSAGRFNPVIRILMVSVLGVACSTPDKGISSLTPSPLPLASVAPVSPDSATTPRSHSAPEVRDDCISRLDARIENDIKALLNSADSALPRRSGIFDVLLPGSVSELKRMNGMAIFALQVFDREGEGGVLDLPVQAIVYSPTDKGGKVRPGSSVSQLPQIFPISRIKIVQPGGPVDIRKLLGTHTQIIYGFIPLTLLFDEGVVAVRYQGGDHHLEVFRTGDRVRKASETPGWLRKISLSDSRLRYSSAKLPDAPLTLRLLADAYCVGRGR